MSGESPVPGPAAPAARLPASWRWAIAGGALLVLALATISRADADLWGHLRYGLDAIEDRGLTYDDPYSFTQDTPWINHEWLSEVQTAIAWHLGGVPGIVLLKATLVFTALWLMWGALRGTRLGVRLGVMALAAVGTVHITSTIRPQVWTFVFFAFLCRALAERRLNWRRWLPVLFAVWANTHGGWVVGLGVLAVWAVIESIRDPVARAQWFWVAPASALATIATPYGWRLWAFILRTVRPERAIAEWQPIFSKDIGFWGPWLLAVLACAWGVWRLRERRWPAAAVVLMLAWASFDVMRILSLLVTATVIMLAPAFAGAWPARPPTRSSTRPKGEAVVAGYLFLAAVAAAGWIGSRTLTCLRFGGPWAPDLIPVRMLQGGQAGRLVTFFDWGQYALWHLGPRLQVSMDGRRETVYSDARLRQHDAIVLGEADGLRALAEWQAEYVWLPARSEATRAWLEANGYRVEHATDVSFLAVRGDLPRLPPVEARPTACFPG